MVYIGFGREKAVTGLYRGPFWRVACIWPVDLSATLAGCWSIYYLVNRCRVDLAGVGGGQHLHPGPVLLVAATKQEGGFLAVWPGVHHPLGGLVLLVALVEGGMLAGVLGCARIFKSGK